MFNTRQKPKYSTDHCHGKSVTNCKTKHLLYCMQAAFLYAWLKEVCETRDRIFKLIAEKTRLGQSLLTIPIPNLRAVDLVVIFRGV